ncbi:MAG: ribosome maturation factor RimM [Dysgonamonadaceae bacterium]|jgi:16S rRNA processing protein RimM|nr:ribosome maturation factor RimM [Dysgonamonadaceae bacterium]
MINRSELLKIGRFRKPHGICGEIGLIVESDCFEAGGSPFLVCETEGIFVPFRIEETRFTSDSSAIVKLKNLDSSDSVRFLSNLEVHIPQKYAVEADTESVSADFFIGYKLIDEDSDFSGEIAGVEQYSTNMLFVVKSGSREVLLPAVPEFISEIDRENREIRVNLPEGLVDL